MRTITITLSTAMDDHIIKHVARLKRANCHPDVPMEERLLIEATEPEVEKYLRGVILQGLQFHADGIMGTVPETAECERQFQALAQQIHAHRLQMSSVSSTRPPTAPFP